MPRSVLEAIKQGVFNYEPDQPEPVRYLATQALPGTNEKLAVMALRVRLGLPLWHPHDRQTFDNRDPHDD